MVDISVELYDGSYHDVDSSEIAFKIAASMGFQEAAARVRRGTVGAYYESGSRGTGEFMGDVTGSLNSSGQMRAWRSAGLARAIKARCRCQKCSATPRNFAL